MAKDMDTGESNKVTGIQVIARAGEIMRALGNNPEGLSLSAIAQEVNLPRSTVQRIINALVGQYLVEPLGPAGGYHLGPAFGQLVSRTQTDIISAVKGHLSTLCEQVNESVCLASINDGKTYVIDRMVAERELRVVFPIGISAPAYATASGKCLLANMTEEQMKKQLPSTFSRFTDETVSRPTLLEQLKEIRQSGIGYDAGEYLEGMSSLAVVVETYMGPFAIAIVAPGARLIKRVDEFKRALLSTKENVEKAIGRR
ncbi:IclR family transcriptional regulator [Pseudomonas sp. S1(2024)]|uniref:IclR family transcriptional regulator n=1 Tax=Pseudomonas sp. S1(2024) TaxID=3390191 RepID=UPI0039787717